MCVLLLGLVYYSYFVVFYVKKTCSIFCINLLLQVLSNPLHGMPPMSMLCMAFIESLLVRKKSSKYALFIMLYYADSHSD